MLADALFLAGRIDRGASVVDVGSGAGAPGLPLAFARPDLVVTLVEPKQLRVATIRSAIGRAGRPGPRVVRARGDELVRRAERFDVAISRATLPPPEWLELGARLAPDGDVWVLLAQAEMPSLAGWSAAEDLPYRWPLTARERRAVRYRRKLAPVPSP
jgi:16S rRNA (guanine527-N7)-methyltransferase